MPARHIQSVNQSTRRGGTGIGVLPTAGPGVTLIRYKEARMVNKPVVAAVSRPLKLYALGHAGLLVGAWAMHASGSMLPLAMAASASLMLTVPLVRHFVSRSRPGR